MGALNTVMTGLKTEHGLEALPLRRNWHRPTRVKKPQLRQKTITVGQLTKSIQPGDLPSILLGQCADSLPLLIPLGDPHMGSILVSCDQGMGKTHQLQVMADSVTRMNSASDVQLAVLTFKPGEWHTWERAGQNKKFLQGIYAWYDPWAEGLIQHLVDLAEARQEGHQTGAHVFLILDDLNFIEELSFEAQVNLHWLLAYGPQAGIWVVGAINAHQAARFRYWVDPFRTRIIGRVTSEQTAALITLRTDSAAKDLEPAMFQAWEGNSWRTYRLPLLGD